MKKHYCDICGKEIELSYRREINIINYWVAVDRGHYSGNDTFDVCNDCWKNKLKPILEPEND